MLGKGAFQFGCLREEDARGNEKTVVRQAGANAGEQGGEQFAEQVRGDDPPARPALRRPWLQQVRTAETDAAHAVERGVFAGGADGMRIVLQTERVARAERPACQREDAAAAAEVEQGPAVFAVRWAQPARGFREEAQAHRRRRVLSGAERHRRRDAQDGLPRMRRAQGGQFLLASRHPQTAESQRTAR